MVSASNPPAIPDDAAGITLRDVLIHVQHHVHRLEDKMDHQFKSLTADNQQLRRDFRAAEKGVDDLDFRVQEIEDENIPPRVRRLELKTGLKA